MHMISHDIIYMLYPLLHARSAGCYIVCNIVKHISYAISYTISYLYYIYYTILYTYEMYHEIVCDIVNVLYCYYYYRIGCHKHTIL